VPHLWSGKCASSYFWWCYWAAERMPSQRYEDIVRETSTKGKLSEKIGNKISQSVAVGLEGF